MAGSTAAYYLLGRIPTGTNAKNFLGTYVLSTADQMALASSAREDARRYIYNAVASFLGGIGGLQTQQAAWAVTKMYYTAFYVGRSALCRSGHLIFHVPKEDSKAHTQYEIRLIAGERPRVVDKPSSTHKLVALRFQQFCYPPFMKGLIIDGSDPILWLMDQREYWQYRASRFPDPDFPKVLDQVTIEKAQRLLAEYAADTKGVYLSDPAHALVSVPFRLLEWALSSESLASPGIVGEEELAYLRRRCRIGKQTLNAISRYLLR